MSLQVNRAVALEHLAKAAARIERLLVSPGQYAQKQAWIIAADSLRFVQVTRKAGRA